MQVLRFARLMTGDAQNDSSQVVAELADAQPQVP
jgi:hypothetical protein